MSFSGASCFFTLFNLQGARRFAAGALLYHIVAPLSSTFFIFLTFFFLSEVKPLRCFRLSSRSFVAHTNFYILAHLRAFVNTFFNFFNLLSESVAKLLPLERRSINIPNTARFVNTFLSFSHLFFTFLLHNNIFGFFHFHATRYILPGGSPAEGFAQNRQGREADAQPKIPHRQYCGAEFLQ